VVKYYFSSSGFVNGGIWDLMLSEFAQIWFNLEPGLKAILLTDNLRFHQDVVPIEKARKLGVELFFLPPNTSHFTQPLDDLVFAVLRSQLESFAIKLSNAYSKATIKATSHEIITAAVVLARVPAFAKDRIVKSFARTCIWPFDAEGLLEAAIKNIGGMVDDSEDSGSAESQKYPLRDLAQKVILDVMEEEGQLIRQVDSSSQRVTVAVKYNQAFSGDAILRLHEQENLNKQQKEEEKRGKELAKEAKAEQNAERKRIRIETRTIESCRVNGCNARWKGSKWLWCSTCSNFGVCTKHWREGPSGSGQLLMTDHEANCGSS